MRSGPSQGGVLRLWLPKIVMDHRFFVETSMLRRRFETCDRVVYRKTKASSRPGQRARLIAPASAGEEYTYCVDKYWIVEAVAADGTLVAKTRRGKLHRLFQNDPNLRHATLRELLFSRARFPTAEGTKDVHPAPSSC